MKAARNSNSSISSVCGSTDDRIEVISIIDDGCDTAPKLQAGTWYDWHVESESARLAAMDTRSYSFVSLVFLLTCLHLPCVAVLHSNIAGPSQRALQLNEIPSGFLSISLK